MRKYVVQQNQKITASTLLITLQRDELERPMAFQPGQYAAISFEHRTKRSPARCFSIVSSPTDQDILQFSMRVRGHFTTALSNLQKDDIVNVTGPFGGFVFDATRDVKAVLIAGGIGITPMISIMKYLAKLNASNNIVLLYGCQNQEDIPFKEDLLSIERQHPNLHSEFVIGKGPIDQLPAKNAATGSISADLMDRVVGADYSTQKFFICGPPGFMKAMSDIVINKGVAKDRIMTEAFTQSSPKQTSILRSWPANVYALGMVGIVLGSFVVMVSDLLKTLPPTTTAQPTKTVPFYITSARKEQLDQLVNTIPPSPSLITVPTSNQAPSATSSSAASQTANTPPPTFAPVYLAPTPRTTVSLPPP